MAKAHHEMQLVAARILRESEQGKTAVLTEKSNWRHITLFVMDVKKGIYVTPLLGIVIKLLIFQY